MTDIRDVLFKNISSKRFRVVITAERSGVLSGVQDAFLCAQELGIQLELCKGEGEELSHGEHFGNFWGTPKQIALAEERLIGTLAKASGIATAAKTAVMLADGNVEIVCGSWKKMPPTVKDMVRKATVSGGAAFRICNPPMVYLDKNFIRMFGSISAALSACENLPGSTRVVQLKGASKTIEEETKEAVLGGAEILMVDTGNSDDIRKCISELEEHDWRHCVKVAFAGNVRLTSIPDLKETGIDILCIGKEIVDAQLLDLKLDVLQEE